MAITAAKVKHLREVTGFSMMDCKHALVEAKGDVDLATKILRGRKGDKAERRFPDE